jgi:16S rRNA (uracil1498-N3)-methyltransferase
MRRRFFVDEIRNGQAELAGDDAQHLTRVLRVEPGQRYEISDNRSVYLAAIETARKQRVVFRTLEKLAAPPPRARMVLNVGLIKFDRFEWMVEKATELGVDSMVPFQAARSERGLDLAARKRVERWRRIALEASQQSRRAYLPAIEAPAGFEEALEGGSADYRFVLDEDPQAPPLLTALPELRSVNDCVAILVGPEGGWTDQERERFTPRWTRVSLGFQILRAETAALAALAILRSAWDSAILKV